ncbi:epithelial zinc-finger EZF protein [Phlyctema vagabunda]|uniref:Epithelial zinc-finger EZF protein n=1 Tax=Phlyctema vagabunda TaxID=108571 RepID=A0ABR4PF53_9HELO
MDLTPQSIRSPGSPYHHKQPAYEYPSPALSSSRYNRSSESLQGLGLYSCQMSNTSTMDDAAVPQLQSSSAASWQASSIQQRATPPTATTNIHAADYNPFGPLHPSVSASYSHDIYGAATAEVPVLPASPLHSGTPSQRSSFSSAPASDIYSQAGSLRAPTPRIKMEDFTEYPPGEPSMHYGSPPSSYGLLPTHTFPGTLEATYFPEQPGLAWPKVEYSTGDMSSSYSNQGYESRSGNEGPGSSQVRRGSSTAARTRQPRKLTTKEEANFQCEVKGCGKLFGRSYNYKAHMETHDASREYPFPCLVKDCTKKFVRKTDLQRHHQSVHMKQRNHRCDYCSRFFARKDTLRRHMEDGCSKRFDIETVDFRPGSYSHGGPGNMKVLPRPLEDVGREASYHTPRYTPPPALPASHSSYDPSLTSAAPGPYYGSSSRPEYLDAGVNGHDTIWNH